MNLSPRPAFYSGHLLLLRVASCIVPGSERRDWRREWEGELWHVHHASLAGGFSWSVQFQMTAFCAGSFPDAMEVRRHAASAERPASLHESPAKSILCLCAVLVVCVVAARMLMGVHAESDSARFQLRPALLSVGLADAPFSRPTISFAQYRTWEMSRQRYFDDLAFYRITTESAANRAQPLRSLRVAHATANLLPILNLPVQAAQAMPGDDHLPALVISREAWIRDFGKEPLLDGVRIRLGGQMARVAGMVSYGSWQLPGHPDAWLLESDRDLLSATPPASEGFVIAHLSSLGRSIVSSEHVPIMDDGLYGTLLDQPIDGPERLFAFALFLALLALPAVTSISMSESTFSSHRPSFSRRLYRWIFLAAKFSIGACIAYYASCDLAYWNIAGFSPMAEFAQFVIAFVLCLFTFRWAVLDQRHRCPVCLRRVTHPAQVGTASCTFLGWNGTEMICTGGHTLLHVPSLPTSWFGAQRWLYLDASWEFLFAGGDVP